MGGKGVSRGHSQPGTSSGKKRLKTGETKGNLDDVVLIDVDSDQSSNVIIIDGPEPIQQTLRGSNVQRKGRKFPLEGVISIDDDESDIMDHPGISDKGGGDLDSDATSSKRCCPSSKNMRNTVDLDGDECCVVHEKRSSFKLSKCNQTYSEKTASRNRYGLDSEFESGSSDSDCSDCELMEGSFGKLHEQWKKASLKRKHDLPNGQSGSDDQTSISGSHTDSPTKVEVENRTEKHPEVPVCSSSSNEDCEKENLFGFFASGDGYMRSTSLGSGMESPFVKFDHRDPPLSHGWQRCNHVNSGGGGFCRGEQSHRRHPLSTDQGQSDKQSKYARSNQEGEIHAGPDRVVSTNKDGDFPQAPSSCNSFDETNDNLDRVTTNEAGGNEEEQVNGIGNGFCNEEEHQPQSSLWSNQEQGGKRSKCASSNEDSEVHVNLDGGGIFRNKDDGFQWAPSCSNFDEKDRVVSNSRSSGETQFDNGVACAEYKVRAFPEESFFCNIPFKGKSGVGNEKFFSKEKVIEDSEQRHFSNTQRTETHLVEAKKAYDVRDQLLAQDGDVTPSCQTDIINEREKLKETDEYKRAIEEEWASRQRQLEIQAEEVQRLRKIKRAERRLLDMQRRQKQRVEEVRETQKKDEENMNLKEQLRVEIRKELNKLEMMCIDMASLLRGLGIEVGGGFYPLPHEVHAAYKRALLKFHPDRASKTDIRQQVEAEEKFKLISRMKEKLLGTSF
ncbi:uncharacterized protein LOC132177333 [Corylus avellana]|uniref:uncharacterized protein LOC132177333 n=1 Tax=Corylus avellana TaxID=13451 RepID=UPI001E1FE014|nr:uncharacterized protein LOC132177333 [Corylus avellana]